VQVSSECWTVRRGGGNKHHLAPREGARWLGRCVEVDKVQATGPIEPCDRGQRPATA